mmetsp:Transcript_14587/g.33348  ORF Transcript_14587/g.33348 Transcript_14587/m.33348 type:complete len:207 (+) Transcript_14587:251-871(+)
MKRSSHASRRWQASMHLANACANIATLYLHPPPTNERTNARARAYGARTSTHQPINSRPKAALQNHSPIKHPLLVALTPYASDTTPGAYSDRERRRLSEKGAVYQPLIEDSRASQPKRRLATKPLSTRQRRVTNLGATHTFGSPPSLLQRRAARASPPNYCHNSKRLGMLLLQFEKTSCSNANLCVTPNLTERCSGRISSCTNESK